jgi:TonB family protein
MKCAPSSVWIGALLAMIVLTAASVRSQDADLAAARDLYASAAYDDALSMLNRLRASNHPVSQSRVIEQYRAFCLLALGRAADAEQAIEAVVTAEPSYHPSDSDVSPRVRSAFATVRRRMLPTLIQQKYAQAKASYDRKDFAAAAAGFSQVLVTLTDPDVVSDATQPPLSDLRTLAVGFEELAAKAAAPPPPSAPPPLPAAPVVVVAAPPRLPSGRPHIYTAEDANVVAPAVLSQALPMFPGQIMIPRTGRLEVVIDEWGAVESAVIAESVTPVYDGLALKAARTWRYKPATLNGVPVKFRKLVQITVKR